ILPSRMEAWKGIDTALDAVAALPADILHDFRLDIIGAGEQREGLVRRARQLRLLDNVVHFLDPVSYGQEFFTLLRGYHLALVPTQASEEARVAFDALACGCVLIHSDTSTLSAAMAPIRQPTVRHAPGD